MLYVFEKVNGITEKAIKSIKDVSRYHLRDVSWEIKNGVGEVDIVRAYLTIDGDEPYVQYVQEELKNRDENLGYYCEDFVLDVRLDQGYYSQMTLNYFCEGELLCEASVFELGDLFEKAMNHFDSTLGEEFIQKRNYRRKEPTGIGEIFKAYQAEFDRIAPSPHHDEQENRYEAGYSGIRWAPKEYQFNAGGDLPADKYSDPIFMEKVLNQILLTVTALMGGVYDSDDMLISKYERLQEDELLMQHCQLEFFNYDYVSYLKVIHSGGATLYYMSEEGGCHDMDGYYRGTITPQAIAEDEYEIMRERALGHVLYHLKQFNRPSDRKELLRALGESTSL